MQRKICCKKTIKDGKYKLSINGIRRAEGGARASAYKSCFNSTNDNCDFYRPIFWYRNDTKSIYEEYYNIKHSLCYEEYGLQRTGRAGCPFGREFEFELDVIKKYEPKLYKAVDNIFGESYEYTRKYREFCKECDSLNKEVGV